MQLIVAGQGALAQEFLHKTHKLAKLDYGLNLHVVPWTEDFPEEVNPQTWVLHVGSGRELRSLIGLCSKHGFPLIQASTGVQAPPFQDFPFAYIEAPNLSPVIIRFFKLLANAGPLFRSYDVSVTESHQASKTTVPGTAKKIAELLGHPDLPITSIRDPHVQATTYGVPAAHLGGHALHDIVIRGGGAEISLGTRVMGRETYVHGVLELIQAYGMGLKPGSYSFEGLPAL
jgi:dihydrodipicolinate reductase